jgi:bifunctional non-homologous end joining protein LigD
VAYPRAKPPSVGVKAPYLGFVEPALASSIAKVPAGDRWIREIKFDGYRVQVHLASEEVKVFTRRVTGPTVSRRSPPTPGTSAPAQRK